MQYVTDEYRITQNDPNITLTAGVANTATVIAKFTCPDRTWFKIRPGDIFSLLAQDTTPTGVATSSVVKLIKTDPNGIASQQLILVDYTAVSEFQDRNKLYTIGQKVIVNPKDQLQLSVTANLATATANTRFQISAERKAQID